MLKTIKRGAVDGSECQSANLETNEYAYLVSIRKYIDEKKCS
jgi:hypothetical protein